MARIRSQPATGTGSRRGPAGGQGMPAASPGRKGGEPVPRPGLPGSLRLPRRGRARSPTPSPPAAVAAPRPQRFPGARLCGWAAGIPLSPPPNLGVGSPGVPGSPGGAGHRRGRRSWRPSLPPRGPHLGPLCPVCKHPGREASSCCGCSKGKLNPKVPGHLWRLHTRQWGAGKEARGIPPFTPSLLSGPSGTWVPGNSVPRPSTSPFPSSGPQVKVSACVSGNPKAQG